MQFGGRYWLETSRLDVWEALNSTDVLKAAIPGCRRIAWTSQSELEAEIAVDLKLARPVFSGVLSLSNVSPAQSYTLSGRGKGGLLGLAHGAADIMLSDVDEGCLLEFTATGGASKSLLRLGKPLIGNSAQAIIDGFFERFAVAMDTKITVLAPQAQPVQA